MELPALSMVSIGGALHRGAIRGWHSRRAGSSDRSQNAESKLYTTIAFQSYSIFM
jgi:hypothetical protein